MLGQTISHYKILSKLGAGGMGVVYKALDTKLDRFVALKFLPPHLSEDEAEKQRFIHEAKAASALDHPNICTIHQIGETEDGQLFICMAYYEGETLAQRGTRGKLQVDEVINIATQTANGLAKAHEHGITHRDLKPANVMITKEGVVKLLDFGLAKLAGRTKLTKTGTTMGTAAYMSPEQVQRLEVDHRTDIWSLGVVMYEMLTGKLPFEGEYEQAVMYAIVNLDAAPARNLNPEIPFALESIVHKCLAQETKQRYQSLADWQADVKAFQIGALPNLAKNAVVSRAQRLRKRKRVLWSSVVATLTMLSATLLYFFTPHFKPALPPMKTTPITSMRGWETYATFSPDGKQIAFTHWGDIYVQLIGTHEPLRITNDPATRDFSPVWAPDGRHIAFARSYSDTSGAIILISALGGAERKLYSVKWDHNIKEPNLSWSQDGKWFAFSEGDSTRNPWKIFLISAETLEKKQLTSPPKNYLGDKFCAFSSDGKKLAFVREVSSNTDDIYVMPVIGGEPKRLTFDNKDIHGLTWTVDSEEIIYGTVRDDSWLWRIPASGGTPQPMKINGFGPSLSRTGKELVYHDEYFDAEIWRLDLSKPNGTAGTPHKFIFSSRMDAAVQISPDQKKIAFASARSGKYEIWVCDSSGRNPLQLTRLGDKSSSTGGPRWSPDSKFIAFDSRPEGHSDIWIVSAEGGALRRATADTSDDFLPSWSWDGRWIYFTSNRSGDFQIWKMTVSGDSVVQVTTKGGYIAFEAPDGKWVYHSKAVYSGGLWKTPVTGGEAKQVIAEARTVEWAVVAEGIYYSVPSRTLPITIKFFDFATEKSTFVATLPDWPGPGLSVSLDRRWLLYDVMSEEGDLMLVENFR